MNIADELKNLVFKRTKLTKEELVCPREHSESTPCVVRDGAICMIGADICIGCGAEVQQLLNKEKEKHGTNTTDNT